ncbi:MAG: PaaI family thioesterase [Gammaproteobacteria bacterium]|nr:PaaI family thioesterase [Gammaproteobacteria bacterium]
MASFAFGPRITAAEFEELARERVPFVGQMGPVVERLDAGNAVLRQPYREDFLRPGGTVAGPVLMGLADLALYAAVLSKLGRVELAVTTSLNINFLRRPEPGDIVAEAKLLKLGKRLAVGEVGLYTAGDPEMVAHVTATYSIPPHHT